MSQIEMPEANETDAPIVIADEGAPGVVTSEEESSPDTDTDTDTTTTTELLGVLHNKTGIFTVADCEVIDQIWRTKTTAVVSAGYAVDVSGPVEDDVELLSRMNQQYTPTVLEDGTRRIRCENVQFAKLIADSINNRAEREDLDVKAVYAPVNASVLKCRDVCRDDGVGVIAGDHNVAAFLSSTNVKVFAVKDGTGKTTELRLVL